MLNHLWLCPSCCLESHDECLFPKGLFCSIFFWWDTISIVWFTRLLKQGLFDIQIRLHEAYRILFFPPSTVSRRSAQIGLSQAGAIPVDSPHRCLLPILEAGQNHVVPRYLPNHLVSSSGRLQQLSPSFYGAQHIGVLVFHLCRKVCAEFFCRCHHQSVPIQDWKE